MTETLLSALRMGFDVSIKYGDVEDCYIVKVSRNKCYYHQVINSDPFPWHTIEDLIKACIRYGMERVLQQEQCKTELIKNKLVAVAEVKTDE